MKGSHNSSADAQRHYIWYDFANWGPRYAEQMERRLGRLPPIHAHDLLTLEDACALTGLSRWTFWREVKRGRLRLTRLGANGYWAAVSRGELQRWMGLDELPWRHRDDGR